MINLLFSMRGRISRGAFWKGTIAVIIVMCAAGALIYAAGGTGADASGQSAGGASLAVYLVCLAIVVFNVFAGLCLTVKRYHDRDKSGWWVLVQLIPIVGSIWSLIELGFLSGTQGANRFGPSTVIGAA